MRISFRRAYPVHEFSQRQRRLFRAGLKSHLRLYPLLSSPFFFVFAFLLYSMPRQNFSTRDISRYEWGATGTIFPSSCYPVSFFAVARPRDLSFAAARFCPPFPPPLSFTSFFLLLAGFRAVAASAPLHHSCGEALPRSALEIDVSSGHIFVTRAPRSQVTRIFPGSGAGQFTGVSIAAVHSSCRRSRSSFSRISNYPSAISIIPPIAPVIPPIIPTRGAFR